MEYRLKAKGFARKVDWKYKLSATGPAIATDAEGANDVVALYPDLNRESFPETVPLTSGFTSSRNMRGKKILFDLMESTDSTGGDKATLDEDSSYDLVNIDGSQIYWKKLVTDGFAEMKFWHEHKKQFPSLSGVAARIFSTPLSSAVSERVISGLQLVVGKRRSMSSSLIDDIITSELEVYSHGPR